MNSTGSDLNLGPDQPIIDLIDPYSLVPSYEWRNGEPQSSEVWYHDRVYNRIVGYNRLGSFAELIRGFNLYPHLYWIITMNIRQYILDHNLWDLDLGQQADKDQALASMEVIRRRFAIELGPGAPASKNIASPSEAWRAKALQGWFQRERDYVRKNHTSWKLTGLSPVCPVYPHNNLDLSASTNRSNPHRPNFQPQAIIIAFPNHPIITQHDLMLVPLDELRKDMTAPLRDLIPAPHVDTNPRFPSRPVRYSGFDLTKLVCAIQARLNRPNVLKNGAIYYHHDGVRVFIKTSDDVGAFLVAKRAETWTKPFYELRVRSVLSGKGQEVIDKEDFVWAFDGEYVPPQWSERVIGTGRLAESQEVKRLEIVARRAEREREWLRLAEARSHLKRCFKDSMKPRTMY
ncbi:hypothetical protein EJ05DRAFT_539476 [Pseudovirgaria hyperparasitica]|uniref:Uncharacterized protein n=1 Tax=Pseudovirgaria hyperparasitica TaxID=470096 RepID=A0A6A6W4P9_9PEZI|nr:uncharacterized protein EJ05DRAFT_539476 [Pseudovirgaria hyperparasitica]KAF2756537.1 hypothetical protein EJ05DRAFT_539476 [Pseudovirgaria hyperparasitica]